MSRRDGHVPKIQSPMELVHSARNSREEKAAPHACSTFELVQDRDYALKRVIVTNEDNPRTRKRISAARMQH